MMIRYGEIYEPVVRLGTMRRETIAFPYIGLGSKYVKRIIDHAYRSNVRNRSQDDAAMASRKIKVALLSIGCKILYNVIDAGFKLCGYVVRRAVAGAAASGKVYVPLESTCPYAVAIAMGGGSRSSGIPATRYITSIINGEFSLEHTEAVFAALAKAHPFYGARAPIEKHRDSRGVTVIGMRLTDSKIVAPIHMTATDAAEHFERELLDAAVFAEAVMRKPRDHAMEKMDSYAAILVAVVRAILMNKGWARRVYVIKHALNPLPDASKAERLKKLVDEVLKATGAQAVTQEVKETLVEDLQEKDLRYILRENQSDARVSGEIVMDQYDVIADEGLRILQMHVSSAQFVRNSIEDYVAVQAPTATAATATATAPTAAAVDDNDAVSVAAAPEWNMWEYSEKAATSSGHAEILPVRVKDFLCRDKKREWVMHDDDAACDVDRIIDLFMIASDLKGLPLDKDKVVEFLEISIKNDPRHDDIVGNPVNNMMFKVRALAEYAGVNLAVVGSKHNPHLYDGAEYYDNGSSIYMILYHGKKKGGKKASDYVFRVIFDLKAKRFLFRESDMDAGLVQDLHQLAAATRMV
jgi:hypothetical protein